MNTTRAATTKRKAFWLRWPFLVTAIPLMIVGLLLVVLVIHEKFAQDRRQSELARIRDAELPIDNASMAQWFFDRTSPQGAPAWREILSLADASRVAFGDRGLQQLPYVGNAPVPAQIRPEEPWPQEQGVAEFLRWTRPLIQRIEEASEYPAPVWQPLEFRGFETLLEELQQSRNLTRLLSLEVEHSLYHRDAERALRGLESMRAIASAFDWELVMVAELIQIATRQVHHGMIRRSLAVDLWSEEELLALADQIGPARDTHTRWRRVIAGERAMVLEALKDPQSWARTESLSEAMLLSIPSIQEPIILAYERIETVGDGGLVGLSERAKQVEKFLDGVGRLVYPAVRSFAAALEREESSRRFALTALAIKRFQLQHDRWPQRLSELEQVGLRPSDWNTVTAGPFGYEVAGDKALLWSYRQDKDKRVPATLPVDISNDEAREALTIIR